MNKGYSLLGTWILLLIHVQRGAADSLDTLIENETTLLYATIAFLAAIVALAIAVIICFCCACKVVKSQEEAIDHERNSMDNIIIYAQKMVPLPRANNYKIGQNNYGVLSSPSTNK